MTKGLYHIDSSNSSAGRRSIGKCLICGGDIYAGDGEWSGDEYIETDTGLIHAEDCIDVAVSEWIQRHKKQIN